MLNTYVWPILSAVAVLIVLALAAIAIYYHWRLYQQRKETDVKQKVIERERADQRQRNLRSVEIICRAVVADQVTLTEASIRVSVLLRTLDLTDEQRQQYKIFSDLASATAHIPILDEWKKLPRKRQDVLERERESIEEKYRDFVVDAARRFLAQGVSQQDNP